MTSHRPAFTRNGLAWLVVTTYCIGWVSYGLGWFKITVPVVTESGQAATADLTTTFLMTIIPLVTIILQFFFRTKIPDTVVNSEKPIN